MRITDPREHGLPSGQNGNKLERNQALAARDAVVERSEAFLVPSMYFTERLLQQSEGFVIGTTSEMAPIREGFEQIRKLLPVANQAGVRIVIGDDYGVSFLPHGHYAEELEFYVESVGIAPLDVIRWATRNGAELMGRGDELGQIAPGRLADLLVVDGDPSAEIAVLQDRKRLRAILKGGVFYKDEL